MSNYLIIFALLILISLSGCSFIKEKFGTKPSQNQYNQNQQQEENQQDTAIPINPQHS